MIKIISWIYPTKSIHPLIPSFISWQIPINKYYHLVASFHFSQIQITKAMPEAVTRGCFVKKWCSLEISQNSQQSTCDRVSFLTKLQASACNFIKQETLAQVFCCEFCEISRNVFFTDYLRATASVMWMLSNISFPFISWTTQPFQKKFFSLVMFKWHFHIKFSWNVLKKLLEECNCSLSPFYMGRNKEVKILHPYFICKCIQPVFIKKLSYCCEMLCTNYCLLNFDILLCFKPFRHQEVPILCKICREKFNWNTFLVSECIFKVTRFSVQQPASCR